METTFLHYARFLMFAVGILPPEMGKFKKRLYLLYGYTVQILYGLLVFSLYLQIRVIRNDNSKLLDAVNHMTSATLLVFKIYIIKTNNFQNLINELLSVEEKINASRHKEILKVCELFERRSKIFQLSYITFTFFSAGVYFISYFVKNIVLWDETVNSSSLNRSLPFSLWLPFREDENYSISFLINFWFGVLSAGYVCIVQILLVNLPLFVSLRLQILLYFLKNAKKHDGLAGALGTSQGNNETVDTVIRLCFYEHLRIIRFTESLNETIKYLIMLEFVLNSVQIALLLFEILTSNLRAFSAIAHLTLVLTQLSIIYWHADEIRVNSEAICQTLYEADWPEFNKDTKIDIQIMMVRSQRPLALTIGPFGEMSLEMLVTIFKAAYTYITFLHRNYGGPK